MLTLPPLALYVHIPWCVRKCPYCDFNSHEPGGDIPQRAYADALIADLETEAPHIQGRRLHSIFFGGGTPSLMKPSLIADVLDSVERTIGFEPDIEITLEANPGTVDQSHFRGFHAAGINRLSIGIQSFDNRQLQQLGRIHDRAAAIAAIESARAAGFDNLNLDLMHGLPAQTPDDALADLALAINLGPTHLSWYQLTIEPNTLFFKHPPRLPEEDMLADIQDGGEQQLAAQGFQQYEISAYSQDGRQSRHNHNYWAFGDYLGIGAGAHGKITYPTTGDILRTTKTRTPGDYLARQNDWLASRQSVSAEELPLEFLMNALRLTAGVAPSLFPQRTGLSLDTLAPAWTPLAARGLLQPLHQQLAATPAGLRYLNLVLEAFGAP